MTVSWTPTFLGDPHLGRKFENGVPLHRRGEREESVWNDFEKSLMSVTGADVHICVGDLFDRYSVPESVVLRAAAIYEAAIAANPAVRYVVVRGNHDVVRKADSKSSFDVFKAIVEPMGVVVVTEPTTVLMPDSQVYGLIPYDPFRAPAELVESLPNKFYDTVVGHWDLDGNGENLIPIDALKKKTNNVVTGHVHLAQTRKAGKLTIRSTGSMQPYAHGEGDLYVTLTVEELVKADPERLKNNCVRLRLQPGEEIPPELPDCLQFTTERVDQVKADIGDVQFEAFSLKGLFDESFKEVDPEIATQVWDRVRDS